MPFDFLQNYISWLKYINLKAIQRILHHFILNLFVSFPSHIIILASPKSAVTRYSQSIMSETATRITFGERGARVVIEDKEILHYTMHVDPAKKEVSCWIPSEAGNVRESRFRY